mmetsp:Transcript_12952/g.30852  ORF Transcript_12952/g.30852 Transcript_12952/m.30852 type:complete len:385 (+) Transcript_12952:146-1300(+)
MSSRHVLRVPYQARSIASRRINGAMLQSQAKSTIAAPRVNKTCPVVPFGAWKSQQLSSTSTRKDLSGHQFSTAAEAPKEGGLANCKLAFIGTGKMAQAIIGGIVRNGVQKTSNISVYDINEDMVRDCAKRFPGVRSAATLFEACKDADMVVLAVKPQNVQDMLNALKEEAAAHGGIPKTTVLISIIAGVPLVAFQSFAEVDYVVRAMPNTPVTVEQGCTVWCCTPGFPDQTKAQVSELFGAIGDEICMSDERFLDMATAISGSGPAYVFLTMEAMIDAGVHMGFPRHIAERLVINTLLGTCLYAIQSGEHVSKLRNDITSPGGTTASAIYNLERGGFRTTVSDAVWAAYRRSLELGGQDSNVGPGRPQRPLPSFWQKELQDDTG